MIREDLPEAVRKRRRRRRRPARRDWAVAAKVLLLLLVESICRLRWWWWWWWWELKVFSAAGCGVANVRGAGKSCRWQVAKKKWEWKSLAAMFALSNCRFLLLLLLLLFSCCCLPVFSGCLLLAVVAVAVVTEVAKFFSAHLLRGVAAIEVKSPKCDFVCQPEIELRREERRKKRV